MTYTASMNHYMTLEVFYGSISPAFRYDLSPTSLRPKASAIKDAAARVIEYIENMTNQSPFLRVLHKRLTEEMLQKFVDCLSFAEKQNEGVRSWRHPMRYSGNAPANVTLTEAYSARKKVLELLYHILKLAEDEMINGVLDYLMDKMIMLTSTTFGPGSNVADYVRPAFAAQKASGDLGFGLICENPIESHEEFGKLMQLVADQPNIQILSIGLESTTPPLLVQLLAHISSSFREGQLHKLDLYCYDNNGGDIDGDLAHRAMAKLAKIATHRVNIDVRMSASVLCTFLQSMANRNSPLDFFGMYARCFNSEGKCDALSLAWNDHGASKPKLAVTEFQLYISGAIAGVFHHMTRSLSRVVEAGKFRVLRFDDNRDQFLEANTLTEGLVACSRELLHAIHGGGIHTFRLVMNGRDGENNGLTFKRLLVESFPVHSKLKSLTVLVRNTETRAWLCDRMCHILEKNHTLEGLTIEPPPSVACEQKLARSLQTNTSLLKVEVDAASDVLSQTARDCCTRNLQNKLIRLAKKCNSPPLMAPAAGVLVSKYDLDVAQSALFVLVNTFYPDFLCSIRHRND